MGVAGGGGGGGGQTTGIMGGVQMAKCKIEFCGGTSILRGAKRLRNLLIEQNCFEIFITKVTFEPEDLCFG